MDGTACNVGSPDEGVLHVKYGTNGSVSITCTPTTLETLAVTVSGGNGSDFVSSDSGISCTSAGESTCSLQTPRDTTVTLVAHPAGLDAFSGWSGGGCSGNSLSCTVTMDQAQNVTATFQLQYELFVTLGVPGVGSFGGGSVNLTVNPGLSKTYQALSNGVIYSNNVAIPAGASVTITVTSVGLGSPQIFWGPQGDACTTNMGNSCTFTMNGGHSVAVGVGFNV